MLTVTPLTPSDNYHNGQDEHDTSIRVQTVCLFLIVSYRGGWKSPFKKSYVWAAYGVCLCLNVQLIWFVVQIKYRRRGYVPDIGHHEARNGLNHSGDAHRGYF